MAASGGAQDPFDGMDLTAPGRRTPSARAPQRSDGRRPRSEHPFVLTVRVDLVGSRPAIWRRVELPSTMTLDRLHQVAQVLFDWTDSHLHRFTLGSSVWDRDAEHFLSPWELADAEVEGTPTSQVRLDEVLTAAGDRLRYVYDFGDEWTLLFRVENVSLGEGRVRCTGGRGDHPPEDSGGVHGWSLDEPGAPFEVGAVDTALRHLDR